MILMTFCLTKHSHSESRFGSEMQRRMQISSEAEWNFYASCAHISSWCGECGEKAMAFSVVAAPDDATRCAMLDRRRRLIGSLRHFLCVRLLRNSFLNPLSPYESVSWKMFLEIFLKRQTFEPRVLKFLLVFIPRLIVSIISIISLFAIVLNQSLKRFPSSIT